MGAMLHEHNGQFRCIIASSVECKVSQDTMQVEGCQEQYGPNATLLAVPESDGDLWDLVEDQLLDNS